MEMLRFHTLLMGYLLVSQTPVDAIISIYSSSNQVIAAFWHRDATVIDSSILGYLELANPPDACNKISRPAYVPTTGMENMVLINGTSECDFMVKIQNAKAVGYEVAILFDPFPEPFNYSDMTFPIPFSKVNMSVVLVSCKDGIALQTNYLYNNESSSWNDYRVLIYPTKWTMAVIYVVGGFFLLCLVFYTSIFCYKMFKKIKEAHFTDSFLNRQRNHTGQETNVHQESSDEEMSETFDRETTSERTLRILNLKFPSKVFTKGDPYETCAICFNDFKVGETFRKLKCPHAYHTECIDPWMSMKRLCPLCKNAVSLENSVELLPDEASDTTPLLASTNIPRYNVQSSTRSILSMLANNSRSNAVQISTHMVEARGSVNNSV